LELDRVGLEHEHSAANRDFERLTQTVEALRQEQEDLAAALEQVTQEGNQCRAAIETRMQDKTEKEKRLADKQTAAAELQTSVQSLEAAVTQSRIRNAALGEKRENTHQNLENRLKQRQETCQQIELLQDRVADIERQRREIEAALEQIGSRSLWQKINYTFSISPPTSASVTIPNSKVLRSTPPHTQARRKNCSRKSTTSAAGSSGWVKSTSRPLANTKSSTPASSS
jgi:hypothetical protein